MAIHKVYQTVLPLAGLGWGWYQADLLRLAGEG